MPRWDDQPPEQDHDYVHRIVRTPADGDIRAIVTSGAPIGCCTHYMNHRTTPCEGPPDCPACKEGFSWRWHGYLSAMLTQSLEHIIFEFTATASDTFRNYMGQHTSLRGCHFKAFRPSKRANGRVVIQAVPADLVRWTLPDPPDLKAILCHVWGVPNNNVVPAGVLKQPIQQFALMPDEGNGRDRA